LYSEPYYFSEISDIIYRIKDFVGIENISTYNYLYKDAESFTRCDMSKLANDDLDIKDEITGGFIVFDFPFTLRAYNNV